MSADLTKALDEMMRHGSVAPDHRLVISRAAWAQLLDYYAERMGGAAPAQRFMDAHFIRAEPLTIS